MRRLCAIELLENRALLAATVSNTSILSSGTLPANSTTLDVEFSEAVIGGNLTSNYELRRSGVDGVLGTVDDGVITINSINASGNIRTLNFDALIQDLYRLTVSDEITNVSSQPLDGDVTGLAGGDYVRDFIVGERLVAWGNNGGGQLGDGTTTNHILPASVNNLTGVTSISAGWDHMLALKSDGTVWAWGYNAYGQLGDGTTVGKATPIQVSSLSNVIAIAAGDNHSLALLADGTVKAWGLNTSGAVGDGTTTNRTLPTTVSGLTGVTSIAGGRDFSFALRSDGTVRSWGLNTFGSLGDGSTTPRLAPVVVTGISNATGIAAGSFHGVALISDGTVRTWGYNAIGQIGDGTTTNRLTAVTVTGLSGVASVHAGYQHSIARLNDGTVRAWGYNQYSQLGDGTTTNRLSPVTVLGLSGVTKIATGGYHSFAILSNKSVRAWGWNDFGQLGDGTTTSRSTPIFVAKLPSVDLISANGASSIALRTQVSATNVRRGTSQTDAALSAQAILLANPTAPSGVYWIDPNGGSTVDAYQVYADMTSSGGGWTQAIRANGTSPNFSYGSSLWTTSALLNPTLPGSLSSEHKNNAFNNLPFNQLMLNLTTGSNSSNVIGTVSGSSMLQVFASNQFQPTAIGRSTWLSAIPGAQLQSGYYAEGLNAQPAGDPSLSRVRFGAIGNQEPDPLSPDSFIGIGGSDSRTSITTGNFLTVTGSSQIASFGSLYARDAVATRILGSSINQPVINPGTGSFLVTLTFSEALATGDVANNYKLVSLGVDNQFGTSDDIRFPVTATNIGLNQVSLSIPPLLQGSYRLIAKSGMNGLLDTAGNSLDGDGDGIAGGNWIQNFSVNHNPTVSSINRAVTTPTMSSASANFVVTFSEPVTGVDAADFQVATTGATTASSTVVVSSLSSSVYNVTVNGISGAGTFGVNLIDNLSIRDATSLGLVSSSLSFLPQQVFSTGATPDMVEVADLNSDGFLDVITPNEGPNRVGVFLGNGDGSFQTQVQYPVGAGPTFVRSGDFNGDGKLDLAVANRSSSANSISILLGNGNGTFQGHVTYAAGTNPSGLAIGDVTRDGILDVVVVNTTSNTVGLFRGNGNGTFQAMATTATGTSPSFVTLVDVDSDGDLDVVNTNSGTSFSVLKNTGSGTFATAVSYGSGTTPSSFAVGDFNGDRSLDLAVANAGAGTVGISLNSGSGAFPTQNPFSAQANPKFVTVGDVNGDSILDLAVANNSSGSVSVFRGIGDGLFQPQQPFAVGTAPSGVALRDLNNDGKLDIISANTSSATISSLLNNSGSFSTGQTYTVLGQVVSTSFMATGTLTSGASSITVTFNGPITGIGTASNYQLQQAGSDGVLLNADSIITPSSVVVSGNTVTLNFATPLVEDVYRLTVKDTITDSFGNKLDGDGDGLPAGDWRRDFVADARQTGLDASFGNSGKLMAAIGEVYGTAVQSDGRVVAVGSSGSQFAIARYNQNGTQDTSFITSDAYNSVLTTDFGFGLRSEAHSVALQSNGKIVVAGFAMGINASPNSFAVARYNSNGFLDLTFSSDGIQTTLFASPRSAMGNSVAVQQDGKIVVAGYVQIGSFSNFAMARYNTNGSLDTTFGVGGMQTTLINPAGQRDAAYSVGVQQDGKIVVAGESYDGSRYEFAVVRFNSDGSLDSTFGTNGRIRTAIGSASSSGRSLVIQSDGKIVVAGYASNGTDNDIALVRYNNDGTLDTTFDGDGILTTAIGTTSDSARSVTIQGDGKLVVAGPSFSGSRSEFTVARYNSNGTPDETFDGDGKITTSVGSYGYANSVAIQENGDIVVAGAADDVSTRRFALAQYSVSEGLALTSQNAQSIIVDRDASGTGQLTQGPNNVFDGLNRLVSAGSQFAVSNGTASSIDDGGRTFVTPTANLSGLDVHREITVPLIGLQSFTRTIEVLTNSTGISVTAPIEVLGNLGSDAVTTVFATSDGDNIVEPTDWWIGTDDGDGIGTPAVIHLLHGKYGLTPISVSVTEDNVDWSYNITVAPGETKRLATFTILGTTRADAIAAVNVLVNANGFGGEAASFLTSTELASLANFQFNQAPTNIQISSSSIAENSGANSLVGSFSTTDANIADGDTHTYSLASGTGSTDNALFVVNGNQLRANPSFDFETKSSYSIRVRTTDAFGLFFEQSFTINVTDVNESVVLTRANANVSGNVLTQLTNTGTWADPESGAVTLSASLGTVTKNADGTWNWAYTPSVALLNQVVTISASDGTNVSDVTFNVTAYTTIATRGIQYLGATGASASTSLATDKVPLLPGQASTFANYTNYSRGLNGLVIDVVGLPATVTNSQLAASLLFANWNGIAAAGFVSLPGAAVPTVSIIAGGVAGSTRVRISFPDNTLQNTWLRVTVVANTDTGLEANDVFYFGNVIGDFDVGNTSTRIRVNALDTSAVRNNQSPGANSAGVTNIFDLNRDGRVNALDTSIVRNNQQASGIVAPITAPSAFGRSGSGALGRDTLGSDARFGEGEGSPSAVPMPSGVPTEVPSSDAMAMDSIPAIGPRWTGESYHVLLLDGKDGSLNEPATLAASVQQPLFAKKKRSDVETRFQQVDDYFASIDLERDDVCVGKD